MPSAETKGGIRRLESLMPTPAEAGAKTLRSIVIRGCDCGYDIILAPALTDTKHLFLRSQVTETLLSHLVSADSEDVVRRDSAPVTVWGRSASGGGLQLGFMC